MAVVLHEGDICKFAQDIIPRPNLVEEPKFSFVVIIGNAMPGFLASVCS